MGRDGEGWHALQGMLTKSFIKKVPTLINILGVDWTDKILGSVRGLSPGVKRFCQVLSLAVVSPEVR
eukprot:10493375-Heterocapsa_arctica.AAC.1